MKKVLFITVLAMLLSSPTFAQQFQKGTSAINLGIGFGSALGGLGTGRPAISGSFEYGMWEAGPGVISLGGYIGNTGYRYSSEGYTQKWNYTVVGARSAYHLHAFETVPQLDPYAGLMIGYNIASYSVTGGYEGPNTYGSGLGYSLFLGARWFFTNNIAVFVELGYGVSAINAGVSFKF